MMLDLGTYHKSISDTFFQGKAWIYNGSALQKNDKIYYVCRAREAIKQLHYQSHIIIQVFDNQWKPIANPRALPIITADISGMDTGPQDARIFGYKNDVWVVFNMLNKDSVRRMHIYNISQKTQSIGNANIIRIEGGDRSQVEKNWTPFVLNDKLFFIYCFVPLVIIFCDTDTGVCKLVYKGENTESADKSTVYRGGSPATFDTKKQIFVGWLHTVSPPKQIFDPYLLPVPARATQNVYRTRKFELKWVLTDKPVITIGPEIVFAGNQIEQVYGTVDGALIVNIDDSKTVVIATT
jgi:hypothetical protein